MSRLLLASLLVLGMAMPARAVPVGTSADTRTAAPQQRKAWKEGGVAVKAGGNWLAGNVNLTTADLNVSANYNRGPHQLFADAGALYTATPAAVLVNRLASSALYAYATADDANLYGYATAASDASIKLDSRVTFGAGGCRHKLFPGTFDQFLLSANPVLELDRYQGGGSAQNWRGVFRANALKTTADNVELGTDLFYAPKLTDPADMRVYGEAYVRVKLVGDALALRLTAADEYQTRPQPGISPNDIGIFSTLEATWGR